MNIIMSYFCFLSVQTVNFCGHIARYGQWSLHPLRFASPPFRRGGPLSPKGCFACKEPRGWRA